MQLRRLTRVFARRTRRFVKPIDCRRYIRLAKALIRLLMCRLRVCRLIRLFVQVTGFTVHRPMRDLFLQTITLNILGKVFNRHFEIFLSFFQENRICISCKLSPLHEMSNPVFLVIKQITISFFLIFFFFFFVVCWISPDSGNSIPASTKCRVFEQDTLSSYLSIGFYPGRCCLECPWRHMTILSEDAFPPMLGLYVRLFYSLNKLWSWFCISNVEDTKTEHFTWKRKFWRLLYKPLKIMLLIYIP